MQFTGIHDVLDKWVIIRFLDWPEGLQSPFTGLRDVEGRWLQYKLKGFDSLGIWLENPYWKVEPSSDPSVPQEQKEALEGTALVLVKWQYVGTIIYLEGQKDDRIPLGFVTPQPAADE